MARPTLQSICLMIAVRRTYNGGASVDEIADASKQKRATVVRQLKTTGLTRVPNRIGGDDDEAVNHLAGSPEQLGEVD